MNTINKEQKAEERAYYQWQNEKKNIILRMQNPEKKQRAWNELFPVMDLNDEWLREATMF